MPPLKLCYLIIPLLGFSCTAHADNPTTEHADGKYDDLEIGEYGPFEMSRQDYEFREWAQYGLEKPAYQTQWVQIGGRFALINIPNDIIIKIVPAK